MVWWHTLGCNLLIGILHLPLTIISFVLVLVGLRATALAQVLDHFLPLVHGPLARLNYVLPFLLRRSLLRQNDFLWKVKYALHLLSRVGLLLTRLLYRSNQRIRSVPSPVVVADVAWERLGGSQLSLFPSQIPYELKNLLWRYRNHQGK